ncbi:VUT family protein [Candidatus Woesearchaeota archaeon]|nr:VUT family protein [Candidatus Woesearchaeota archaeon]
MLLLIAAYLVSIVAANLLVAYLGPGVVIINAFLFIGLDLTARDRLHERWHRKNLWLKMLALISAGSIISFLISSAALQVAVASFFAFLIAGIVDFVVYDLLYRKKWMVKANGSNAFSALADSIVFPTLAFGAFMPLIILGQFAAKFAGGFVWSVVLSRFRPSSA